MGLYYLLRRISMLEVFGFETFAWEPSFRIIRLGTFELDLWFDIQLGKFAWKFSLIFFRLGAFAWDLSRGNFRLGSSALTRSSGNCCVESFAWELSLENLRLTISVWDPSFGNFRFEIYRL